ncbi:methyl-accepting chemotaxis protein [Brevibacillus sp. SYP-B805]|uniref:methyl-accepting chemotaxis protein n=1 Tax=Brevibacillus sp. SYP-B805 TaxID=1578199 RepID=UPI0013EBA9D0|nr:methyl-accepting chemotaxis protein [Brevibacillus sp. SYP-B805]NGQ93948.1 methyl-accepting chemotaxis protein [Brevibacillus sp. SYP-B805]
MIRKAERNNKPSSFKSWKWKNILSPFASVRGKLFLFSFLILLIPGIVIGWLTYAKSQAQIEELLMNSATENVALTNRYIDNWISTREQELDSLSKQIADSMKQNPNLNLQAFLQQFLDEHPGASAPFIAMDNGTYIHASKDVNIPADYNAREMPWYNEAVNNDKVILTDPYADPISGGQLVITAAKAVPGQPAVVGFNINLEELRSLVKDVHIGQNGYIVIYTKNKQFLIHPTNKIGTPTSAHNEVMYREPNASGSYEYIFKGEPKKMIYVTNPITGWKVAGNMSSSEISDLAKPILNRTLLVVAVALLIGAIMIYFIIMSIIRPLNKLVEASGKISQGDLTQRVEIKREDEIGKTALSFNQMADSLHAIIKDVRDNATRLSDSSAQLSANSLQNNKVSEQIAEAAQTLAAGSEKQVRSVEESTKAIAEILSSSQQIMSNVTSASESSKFSSDKALEGATVLQSVSQQMNSIQQTVSRLSESVRELGSRSQKVTEIIGIIGDISSQTKLLALNAAIEAARAGEQGRGFAVVASEVRKLAEQSAVSSEQIEEDLLAIRNEIKQTSEAMETAMKEVQDGMEMVLLAGQSFEAIQSSVQTVVSQIEEVATASRHMAAFTDQVSKSIEEVSEVTEQSFNFSQELSAAAQEQLASVEEVTASAAYLSSMSESLKELVGRFKI